MSELPFELSFAKPEEGIVFCGVTIPKYGSLTPNEAIALKDIVYDSSKPAWEYYAEICKVILRSRTNAREYSSQEFLNFPIAELEKLADFTLSENRQWKKPEEEIPSEGESPIGRTPTGDSDSDTPTNSDLVEKTLAIARS